MKNHCNKEKFIELRALDLSFNKIALEIGLSKPTSIFPAKLHFCEDGYRTTPLNPALALILQKKNGLENEKTRQNLFEETLSGGLPVAGLEPISRGNEATL